MAQDAKPIPIGKDEIPNSKPIPIDEDKIPVKRENIVGKKPLDYSKFDDLDFESDEDDCHPNIEIGTWRRLKERMRKEKGLTKKEVYLKDKWNTTTTNKEYHIDPKKPPKTSEEQKKDKEEREISSPSNNNDSNTNTNTTNDNDANPKSEELKSADSTSTDKKDTEKTNGQQPDNDTQAPSAPSSSSNGSNDTESKPKSTGLYQDKEEQAPSKKDKAKEIDDEPYKARSNPQTFLDENLEKLRKFAKIKKDTKADKFLKKNPELVHEASEGFLITYAVDRAVEGAGRPELARLSRRCLMVHNLVQSCSQQNVSPIIGVERFYSKIASNEQLIESYKVELNKQVKELMERIEQRRVERIAELQDIPDEYDEDEKAPVGPCGLDPTDVLNSLPKEMQDAFINQDVEGLKTALAQMDKDMAEYQMKRCIDAGLWVQPESDGDDDGGANDEPQQVQNDVEEPPKEVRKEPRIDEVD